MVEKENPEDDHDVGDLSARIQASIRLARRRSAKPVARSTESTAGRRGIGARSLSRCSWAPFEEGGWTKRLSTPSCRYCGIELRWQL